MNEYNKESIINNEYDYSNILPTVDYVLYLVQYCDQVYNQLLKFQADDEEKNKQFKEEYREYNFKKKYSQGLEIYIKERNYHNNITCKDYNTFKSAVDDGNLNNVIGVDIKLYMDFERGRFGNYESHENTFTILFKPYEITFSRKSNYNDINMSEIEKQINEILKKFPIANCIFCNKQN